MAWRELLEHPYRWSCWKTGREKLRRLPGADERAGEDLLDDNVQPDKTIDGFLEPRDPALDERPLRIIGPLRSPFRGNGMADDRDFHGQTLCRLRAARSRGNCVLA